MVVEGHSWENIFTQNWNYNWDSLPVMMQLYAAFLESKRRAADFGHQHPSSAAATASVPSLVLWTHWLVHSLALRWSNNKDADKREISSQLLHKGHLSTFHGSRTTFHLLHRVNEGASEPTLRARLLPNIQLYTIRNPPVPVVAPPSPSSRILLSLDNSSSLLVTQ